MRTLEDVKKELASLHMELKYITIYYQDGKPVLTPFLEFAPSYQPRKGEVDRARKLLTELLSIRGW